MSDASNNSANLMDPFGFWKTVRDTQLESWSKLMIDFVNSDEYARSTGMAMEQILESSQPFRNMLERTMTQTLSLMNMPSRDEVSVMAGRMTSIEMRLDDMDAKLSKIHESLSDTVKETVSKAVAAFPEPPSTRPLENRVDKLNARIDALLEALGHTEAPAKPGPKTAQKKSQESPAKASPEKA